MDAADVSDPKRLALSLAGADTPCQAEVEGDQVKVSWLIRKLGAGKSKKFDVKARRTVKAGKGVELLDDPGEKVSVFLNGKLFTNYYYGEAYPRPFLHPLIGPYGKTVTRNFPMPDSTPDEKQDHPHHRSVWSAWGELNGTDNWSEQEGHGRQVHRKFVKLCEGPVFGKIVTQNDWVSKTGKKVCEEVREMTFYNHPAALRMIDYNVTYTATEGKLEFGDTKEGGILGVRVASTMDVPVGGKIVNGHNGIDEKETWGKRAPWCDYSGPVHGKTVGIAILDHPDNFRFPTYWHVRNYGLMTANPFGISYFKNDKEKDGTYTLPAGAELPFRYRLIVHKGDAEEAQVSERFHDFINPPTVE